MRIAHVITRLLRAGSEENTIACCLHQARLGNDVYLVHGMEYDQSYYDELGDRLKLVKLDRLVHQVSPIDDCRSTLGFAKFCRRESIDIVHTHQSKAGIIGRIGAGIARVPTVVHGIHIAPFLNVGWKKRSFYIAAERVASLATDAFVSVSEGMRDAYTARRIGRLHQHYVVPSGMDLEKFRHAQWPADWRSLLNLAPDVDADHETPPVVLMLAAHEPRKRHIPLVNAFREVLKTHPSTILLLAGGGPGLHDTRAFIKSLGLEGQIKCLGYRNDPEHLIALADVCVLCSMREGFPRVVVQYIAGGKPVVVSDLPGLSYLVVDGKNGVVTAAEDVDEIGKVLSGLFDDSRELKRLTEGARATDVSRWELNHMCEGVMSVYRRLLESPER